MHRGQATIEYVALLAVAAVLVAALLALARGAPGLSRAVGRAISPSLGHGRIVHTPDERALRNPRLAALVSRALPALVLERDRYGDDDEVPVDASCRQPACARSGVAQPVLYVHVSQRRSGPVVELWTYYPDSRTDHLPVAVMQGYHHDDWEGLLVAFDAAGRVLGARATAHAGFNGTTPWWDESRENWAPYGGVAYRASGSHAVGLRRADIDLAGDGWSGDLATIPPAAFRLLAADRAAVWARPFSAEVAPPWRKSAWSDPGVRGTGESGDGRSRLARAARAWARGEHVVGALPLDPAEQRVEAPTG